MEKHQPINPLREQMLLKKVREEENKIFLSQDLLLNRNLKKRPAPLQLQLLKKDSKSKKTLNSLLKR